jgi:hypothetical protein
MNEELPNQTAEDDGRGWLIQCQLEKCALHMPLSINSSRAPDCHELPTELSCCTRSGGVGIPNPKRTLRISTAIVVGERISSFTTVRHPHRCVFASRTNIRPLRLRFAGD